MSKEKRLYNGGEKSLQQVILEKLDNNTETNEVRHTLSPYIKTNAKWLKDLKIRNDSIKLEEITGKTFSDMHRTSVFLGQSPEAIEPKIKINVGCNQTHKLLHKK